MLPQWDPSEHPIFYAVLGGVAAAMGSGLYGWLTRGAPIGDAIFSALMTGIITMIIWYLFGRLFFPRVKHREPKRKTRAGK